MRRFKPKIRVVFGGGPYRKRRNCVIDGNKVIIKQGAKGRGGAPITATFDSSCYLYRKAGFPPFRTLKPYLILKEGASKCVSFTDKDNDKAPSCTKQEVGHYGEATVIKLSGSLKPPFNLNIVYVLLIISIIIGLVSIGIGTGNIRI